MTKKQLNILAWVILLIAAGAAYMNQRDLVWGLMAAYLLIFVLRLTGWLVKKED